MAQITAPGDVVLVPDPSYLIHAFGFLMAGGVIRSVPSEPTPDFFRPWSAIVHSIQAARGRGLLSVEPHRLCRRPRFLQRARPVRKKHGIFVLSDLAYAEVYFSNPPPSVLQVPGALDIAVEFTSMSKTYSMPGWRIGFAVGNERIIAALGRVKSYLDYGAFTPVQVAATAALNGPDDCIHEMRATYKRRRDVLVESFGRAGWDVPAPRASMFAWAPIPEPFASLGSVEFSTLLVEKARSRSLRHRLRRARRRLRAHRAGRERAAHPPGRPQHPPLESAPESCTTSFRSPRARRLPQVDDVRWLRR